MTDTSQDPPSQETPAAQREDMATHVAWMKHCIAEAQRAGEQGEVPVAAIVVSDGQIIGRGYNLRESTGDPTAHAEIIALKDAARTVGYWRVLNSTLYVTLEPCPMCAGALVNTRITRLVYGALDPKAGAVDSLYQITTDARLNHRLEVVGGICADECAQLLKDFFKARRGAKRKFKPKP